MKVLHFLREAFIVASPLLVAVAITEAMVFGAPIHDPAVGLVIGMAWGIPGGLGSFYVWLVRLG